MWPVTPKKCFLNMTNKWSLKLNKYYRMSSHQKAASRNSHLFKFQQSLYSHDWKPTVTVKKYEKAELSTCSAKLLLVISISFCSSCRLSNNNPLLLGIASAYKNKPSTLSDAYKRCEKCNLQLIYLSEVVTQIKKLIFCLVTIASPRVLHWVLFFSNISKFLKFFF